MGASSDPTPAKPANKAERPTAELVEGDDGTKRNVELQSTVRTQSREAVTQAQARIRGAVTRNEKEKLTALLHHVSIDVLRWAFFNIKKQAAPGVDGLTWADYAADLDRNLTDLHARVHSGAYRALPSRRTVHTRRRMGGNGRSASPRWKTRSSRRAVVEILTPIYEEDFLGFSYGFRPGRSQHDALDALAYGINARKMNWILDADISRFLDPSSHYTSVCGLRAEEIGVSRRYFDSQAFSASAADVHGLKLAALYTLQHVWRETPRSGWLRAS